MVPHMILRMAGYDRVLSNLQRKGLMNQMLTLTMADKKFCIFLLQIEGGGQNSARACVLD